MLQLSHILIAFICIIFMLFASPQVQAGMPGDYQEFLYTSEPRWPHTKAIPEIPPDADVVVEVVMTKAYTAYIVKVIKTSDARIRQGDEIYLAYAISSCGPAKPGGQCSIMVSTGGHPSQKSGDKGTIIAKIGTDGEGRLLLCPYTYSFRSLIETPLFSDCFASEAEEEKQNKLAAENGDVKAQIALGLMYDNKGSIRYNIAEAMKWFHIAAASWDAEAQYILGTKYQRNRNANEAVQYFKLAAAVGYSEAMYSVGEMCEYEQYGLKPIEAEKWHQLAAKNGNERAKYSLKYLEKRQKAKWGCNINKHNTQAPTGEDERRY